MTSWGCFLATTHPNFHFSPGTYGEKKGFFQFLLDVGRCKGITKVFEFFLLLFCNEPFPYQELIFLLSFTLVFLTFSKCIQKFVFLTQICQEKVLLKVSNLEMNALLHNYQNPTETVETIEIWFPRWSIKVGHQNSVGPLRTLVSSQVLNLKVNALKLLRQVIYWNYWILKLIELNALKLLRQLNREKSHLGLRADKRQSRTTPNLNEA